MFVFWIVFCFCSAQREGLLAEAAPDEVHVYGYTIRLDRKNSKLSSVFKLVCSNFRIKRSYQIECFTRSVYLWILELIISLTEIWQACTTKKWSMFNRELTSFKALYSIFPISSRICVQLNIYSMTNMCVVGVCAFKDIADPFYAHCKQHADKTIVRMQRRNWLAIQSSMKNARRMDDREKVSRPVFVR